MRETLADGVEIYLGDCRDILPTLPRVDALVTDPPYGIARVWTGGASHRWRRVKDRTAARNEWDARPIDDNEINLLLRSAETQIIWGGNYFNLPPSRCWLVWNKPERNFTLAEAELAWTNMDAVVRVFDHARSEPGREHDTQKPVALMRWCIDRLPATAATILDPYMGSGTTGVAAVRMGRRFIGIERDAGYYSIARRRILSALQQPDFFVQIPKRTPQSSLL